MGILQSVHWPTVITAIIIMMLMGVVLRGFSRG